MAQKGTQKVQSHGKMVQIHLHNGVTEQTQKGIKRKNRRLLVNHKPTGYWSSINHRVTGQPQTNGLLVSLKP